MKTNVMVQLKGPVSPEQMRQIAQSLRARTGIFSARPGAGSGRLLVVDYDGGTIGSRSILDTVRGEGVAANLVGL